LRNNQCADTRPNPGQNPHIEELFDKLKRAVNVGGDVTFNEINEILDEVARGETE